MKFRDFFSISTSKSERKKVGYFFESVGSLTAAVAGLTAVTYSTFLERKISSEAPVDMLGRPDLLTILTAAVSATALFVATLTYLNRTRSKLQKSASYFENQLREKISEEIFREIDRIDYDNNEIIDLINNIEIKNNATNHSNSDEYQITNESIKESEDSNIVVNNLFVSRNRMISEINSLESRGVLNLTIGIMATFIGIIILVFFVFFSDHNTSTVNEFVNHFLPRLSVVIFVQIFAFFFLNLYKSNLMEIKYYHNELTGIEARISSVSLLFDTKCEFDHKRTLISTFSNTDRNKVDGSSKPEELDATIDKLTKIVAAVAPLASKK